MKHNLKRIFEDYVITKEGAIFDKDGFEIDTFINPCGYVSAVLNGSIVTVAYLVGKLYVDNPNKCICIRYKDNNYNNINAENLEWYYEGEELIEDKAVIEVNENGEVVEYYNTLTDCADYYELKPQSLLNKILGRVINISDDNYFFFEDSFNMEELEKRVEEKNKKINEYEQRKAQLAQKRASQYNIYSFTKKNNIVYELNENGDIVAEYESVLELNDKKNLFYLTTLKIIKTSRKIKNNYIIYKREYDKINDIKKYIIEVDKYNKRVEEIKAQKKVLTTQNREQLKENKRLERKRKREEKELLKQKKREERQKKREERQKKREEKQQQIKQKKEKEINILQLDYNGNIIKGFNNYFQTAKALGYTDVSIKFILTGEMKQRKEFYLIYKKDYNPETIKEVLANADIVTDKRVVVEYDDGRVEIYDTAVNASKVLKCSNVLITNICNKKYNQRKNADYKIYFMEDYLKKKKD